MVLASPLIDVDALRARLHDPSIRIVDCRWYLGRPGDGRRAYEAGHIPGAIHLDIDGDLAASPEVGPGRHPLPDVTAFVRRLEAAGIGDEHHVVVYDDVGGGVAVEEPAFAATTLHLADHWTRVIDVDALRPRLGSVVLLDARGGPRYRG